MQAVCVRGCANGGGGSDMTEAVEVAGGAWCDMRLGMNCAHWSEATVDERTRSGRFAIPLLRRAGLAEQDVGTVISDQNLR